MVGPPGASHVEVVFLDLLVFFAVITTIAITRLIYLIDPFQITVVCKKLSADNNGDVNVVA